MQGGTLLHICSSIVLVYNTKSLTSSAKKLPGKSAHYLPIVTTEWLLHSAQCSKNLKKVKCRLQYWIFLAGFDIIHYNWFSGFTIYTTSTLLHNCTMFSISRALWIVLYFLKYSLTSNTPLCSCVGISVWFSGGMKIKWSHFVINRLEIRKVICFLKTWPTR